MFLLFVSYYFKICITNNAKEKNQNNSTTNLKNKKPKRNPHHQENKWAVALREKERL